LKYISLENNNQFIVIKSDLIKKTSAWITTITLENYCFLTLGPLLGATPGPLLNDNHQHLCGREYLD